MKPSGQKYRAVASALTTTGGRVPWIAKLRRERASSVSLVPIRVIASAAPTARSEVIADGAIEVELRSGVRLRLAAGANLDYVAALAQRLG